MAFANFFFREEQALCQVTGVNDTSFLQAKLSSTMVAVAFDDEGCISENGRIILELAMNLMARMYPRLGVLNMGANDHSVKTYQMLIGLAREINPNIEIVFDSCLTYQSVICVGRPSVCSNRSFYLSANSWNVEVSADRPGSGLTGDVFNPISAAAAACFGCAEVFKQLFSDYLVRSEPSSFVLSLLTLRKEVDHSEEMPPIVFKDVTFVGLGAIGTAAIWCLSKLKAMEGNITLVDPEEIDLSNLQRYILSLQSNVGESKVMVAHQAFQQSSISVQAYNLPFGDYVTQYRKECIFDVIAVSVDNVPDRMASQAVLPRVAINAWTREDGWLGVSDHRLGSSQACLACLYLETAIQKSQAEIVAELTGFDPKQAAEMLVQKSILTAELLSEIATKRGYDLEQIRRWEGKTLDMFYVEAVCGGILIKTGGENKQALVPLPHQSALAGVLLACQVVKEALGRIELDSPVSASLSIVERLPDYIPQRRAKKRNCICQDPDYQEVYREKYGISNDISPK